MSRTFDCLGSVFSIYATDPTLQKIVEDLYAPFGSDEEPTVEYRVITWLGDPPAGCAVYADGGRVCRTDDPGIALAHLVWEINQNVIKRATSLLLLHAAAAELDGRAVLLAAASGGGKSTLVAGLLARELGYLTDDIAAFDPVSGMIHPYPKPLSVARSIWKLFPQVPDFAPEVSRYMGEEGFLTPRDLGGFVGRPSPPRLVVFPRFIRGARTQLHELSRAASLILLAEQSFNGKAFGGRALSVLSGMLEPCRTFRLEYSDLTEGVEVVHDRLAEAIAA